MLAYSDTNILDACRTLFGATICASPEFLLRLKSTDVKSAFRKRAKETHPDLFVVHDPAAQRKRADTFQVVNEAYDIIRKYCERRDRVTTGAQLRSRRRKSASATPSFHVDNRGWRFRGVIPEQRLEIGRYLYYRGCIPYRTLIKALAWQMRQRPAVGAIAKQWGWLNDNTIRAILSFRGRPHRLFTERAQQLGFLTAHQARLLLAYQRTVQKRLGRYFVEQGHLSHEEMEILAADLRRHNARFPLKRNHG